MKHKVLSKKIKIYLLFLNFFILLLVGLIQYGYQVNYLNKKFNDNIENIIKKEFSNNISTTKGVLTSLSSVYKSINNMNQSEFTNLSKDLLSNYKYMKGIGFATIVTNEDKDDFIDEIRDLGLFNFNINTFDKNGKISKQEDVFYKYAPIIYIEPSNYKYAAFYGFDLINDNSLKEHFINAAKKDKVVIIDEANTPLGFNLNLFLKATYKGENEINSESYRFNNTNGFFIIDVDVSKLLINFKDRLENYDIKILTKENYKKFIKDNYKNKNDSFNRLSYFKKIDEFNNYYLFVNKNLTLKDFSFGSFLLVIFLVIIIQILYVVVWYKDKETKVELKYKATHDDLTGLTNRNFFKKEFHKIATKRKVQKRKGLIALLFIDLDRFKEINDSFGHKYGDDVLIEISKRFKSVMRNSDLVCRHGGDEFLILINNFDNIDFIEDIVKKIMNSMEKPISFNNHKIHMTLSIGIALYPNDALTVDELLRNADSAMYKAKDEGRNTYRFYKEDMTSKIMQKLVLENKIRDGIQNREFLVYFQPQFSALNDTLIGMEALVRWKNQNELISPAKFIPVAEDTGLIVQLDRFVMEKAIEQFSIWTKRGYNTGTLSLNLSMKQLKSDDFISTFKDTIFKYNCEPSTIELEVTEGEIMENPSESIEKLKELSSFGIKLSVDDFGTGYSSLAYLKKLPIDKLKIDRAFVKELPECEDDIAITKSIIALAKSLKLDLIAEGVENLPQKEFLLKHGCDKIQGYYYGKPMPANEFELIFDRNS